MLLRCETSPHFTTSRSDRALGCIFVYGRAGPVSFTNFIIVKLSLKYFHPIYTGASKKFCFISNNFLFYFILFFSFEREDEEKMLKASSIFNFVF